MSVDAVHTVVLDEYDAQRNEAQEQAVQAQVARHEPDKAKSDALQLDDQGLYRMVTQLDEFRVAKMLMDTGAVPKSFATPQQVMMAIQALKSLKLNWRTAIRQCGFNQQGTFMVYGDLELAVVRQSGWLVRIREFLYVRNEDETYTERTFANANLHLPAAGAVCMLWRQGFEDPHEATCSVEDAQAAGLWGKTPTWRNFPGRMMQMRARGMAIRNTFSDVTQGLAGVEYDHEGIDYDRK